MRNWLDISKKDIFYGTDNNGNRYLGQFLRDYKEEFAPDVINAGCQGCLDQYYSNMVKKLNEMGIEKNKSGYVLKAKYNGIPLKFGSPILVTNTNIDDKMGKYLIENHAKGAGLFESVAEEKKEEKKDELSDKTRKQLDKMAAEKGLNPKDYGNKGLIIDAIEGK